MADTTGSSDARQYSEMRGSRRGQNSTKLRHHDSIIRKTNPDLPATQRFGLLGARLACPDSLGARCHIPAGKAVGDMNPKDLELLVTREMPFGMHKGRIIADLPGNHLNWFARKEFPAGEIGRLLALMQEIDHNGLTDILTPLRQRSGNLPGRPD